MVGSNQAVAGVWQESVQLEVKDLLGLQTTMVQYDRTYEIMHLAYVFCFKQLGNYIR